MARYSNKLAITSQLMSKDLINTKLWTMEEFVVPGAALKAFDFLPYMGHRTNPAESEGFVRYASERRIIAGEPMSLKSKIQRESPDFESVSSKPT